MRQFLLLTIIATLANSAWAGANVWTSLGPDGGAARSVVVDPHTPGIVYAVTSAGLFKSTDGGVSWGVTPPLPPGSGVIDYLVFDPQNTGTLYAATQRTFGIPCHDYVFKSTDGGAGWRALKSGVPCGLPLPPLGDPHVGLTAPLAIDPQDPNTIYSGSYSDIFKSVDGGETWRASNAGLPPHYFIALSLTIDPQDSRIVYASTGVGIFKSTDKGESWSGLHLYVGSAVDPAEQQFGILAIDPKNSSTLYGGNFKSTDGGKTWIALGSGLPATHDARPGIGALVIDPRDTGILYAATAYGVFKSTDAGAGWNEVDSGLRTVPVTGLAMDPQNTNTVYVSLETGIYKTTDGASSWKAANSGMRAVEIDSLAIDPGNPGTIYANTPSGVIKSTDGGASWNELNSMNLAVIDSQTPATLYALGPARPDGLLGVFKSTDGGATWNAANAGLPAAFCHSVASLALDPQNRGTVYAAVSSGGCNGTRGGGVWKSIDGGTGWTKLASTPSGGGVHGLVVDPESPDTLYAWNGKGLFKSTDGGTNWDTLRAGFVNSVKIDPLDPRTLYAVLNDESIVFVTGDKPGVYKSTDGGASWSAVNSGLPTIYVNFSRTDDVTGLLIDPRHTGTLYAATGANGVYRSTDGGRSWNPVNSGLTSLSVRGLAMDSQNTATLYAGTPGGVFAITFDPEVE